MCNLHLFPVTMCVGERESVCVLVFALHFQYYSAVSIFLHLSFFESMLAVLESACCFSNSCDS